MIGNRFKVPAWALRLYMQASLHERIIVAVLAALLLASGLIFIVRTYRNNTTLVPQSGGTYTEASFGQPRYLNPILAQASDLDIDITRLVYSPLFSLDNSLNVQNELAERYELSADRKEYTIYLKQGVTWHDGEIFNADDVVFTIRSIQTPDYGSPLLNAFQGVEVSKVDDHTVLFKLKQPYAPFLSSLTVGITPQHVWENVAPKNAALAEQMLKPVGTGPYKFSEITTRRKTGEIISLELVRNPSFFGTRPHLDTIVFTFYPTHEEAYQALEGGRADGISFLPLQLFEQAVQQRSLTIKRLFLPQYFALFFNQEKQPKLKSAELRQALSAALDRHQIVSDALHHEGEPLAAPLIAHPPITPNDFPPGTTDIEAAKKLLDDAGWKDIDGDGVREKNDERLHLTISTTDWPEYVKTAELVQQQWRAIGVETEIKHFGAGTIQQSVVRPRDYDVLLFGEILSAFPDPYPFWHSSQIKSPGLNLALLQDKDIDRLLEDARQSSDPEQQKQKYTEFLRRFANLKPAVILYQPHYLFAASSKVHSEDVAQATLPSDRFNSIESWYVKTRRIWK